MRKVLGGTLLLIIIGVAGIMFLVRGCLSKYDERSALSPSLYFEKNGQTVLFSIINFEKATSYSQNGGFIRKTVNTTYFIQNNDPVTGEKLKEREVQSLQETKRQPVEIIGKADGKAFVFMGELMAFDPFTLETVVNQTILERINPQLKGSFPSDRKYYVFQPDSSIVITMRDGSPWKLNTKNYHLTTLEETIDDADAATAVLQQQLDNIRLTSQELLANKLRPLSDMLLKKEITLTDYNRRIHDFMRKRNELSVAEDSVRKTIARVEKMARKKEEQLRSVFNLQNNHSAHFAQAKLNMDTLNGRWFGVYTKEEVAAFGERFQDQASYADPARRIFYSGKYAFKTEDELRIDGSATINIPGAFFLNGGFLLDKFSGRPIHLKDQPSFLVISKDQVGTEGKIIVNRVNADGKVLWMLNSELKEWSHWIVAGNRLIILGTNNKELSTGNINLLLSVDLDTGLANKYDFFKDK